jgi:glycosyltransferase involved in cell wall biosynthesis
MRKLKVLHLTFDMRIGGTEQVIKNLIEATDTQKFEVSIFCIEKPIGPFGKLLIAKGINIYSFNRKNGLDFSLIKQLRSYIKEHKIDILHCHQYTPWFYGVLSKIFLKTKVVFTEHGRFYPDQRKPKRRLINHFLSLLTSQIISISKATKVALVDYEYLKSKNIDVIYNGIAIPKPNHQEVERLREEYGLSDENIVFGTVARLEPIKNQVLLINAFHQVLLQNPNVRLVIVGDGAERGNLERLVIKLDMTQEIVFTGYITEPINYMSMMDVFLLTSLSEGTSMTLLEAMSLSKPCIVTDAGGNPEVIQHQFNGMVTENKKQEPIVIAMLELLKNKELRLKYGANGLSRFNEQFLDTAMARKYQEAYQKITNV